MAVIIVRIGKADEDDLTVLQGLLAVALGSVTLRLPTYYSLHIGA